MNNTKYSRVFRFQLNKCQLIQPRGIPFGPQPRSGHRIVSNKQYVYMFGGYNPEVDLDLLVEPDNWLRSKPLLQEMWRFSRITGLWEYVPTSGSEPTHHASHCSAMLGSYLMFVFGGTGHPFSREISNQLHLFDMTTNSWSVVHSANDPSDVENIPPPAYGQAMLIDQQELKLYMSGGTTGFEFSLELYCFDFRTKMWSKLSDTPAHFAPRYRHEMALWNRKLFIIGGGDNGSSFRLNKIPVFDLESKQWYLAYTKASSVLLGGQSRYPKPRLGHGCCQLANRIYLVGGFNQNNNKILNDTWCLNLDTLQWIRIQSATLPEPMFLASATVTEDGELFVYGGLNGWPRDQIRTSNMYRIWVEVPRLESLALHTILQCMAQKTTILGDDVIGQFFSKHQIRVANFEMLDCD